MTGPRVDPPGADKHGTPIMPRVLSPEEWEQAQGMGPKALTAQPFPYHPPAWKPDAAGRMGALRDGIGGAAPRDVTRTPMDPAPRGYTLGAGDPGLHGVLTRQVAKPMLEHPWMTAGMIE